MLFSHSHAHSFPRSLPRSPFGRFYFACCRSLSLFSSYDHLLIQFDVVVYFHCFCFLFHIRPNRCSRCRRPDFLVIVLTFVCKQNHSQQFTGCLSTNKSKLRKYQKRSLCSVRLLSISLVAFSE